jgi:uncharacterized membrane protein YeaQ/YmgE (transglycosylase-associated protein family)
MVGEIIGAVFLGIVAGYLARALVPGKQDIGFLWTVALGIGGALVGYFLFTELLGIGDDDKFDFGGILGAIIGAIILLLIYIKFFANRSPAAAEAGGRQRGDREERAARADREERGGRSGREGRGDRPRRDRQERQ